LLTFRIDYTKRELWYRREGASLSTAGGPGTLVGLEAEKTILAVPPPGGDQEPEEWFDLFVQRGLVELFAFGGRVPVSLRLYPEERRLSLITRA
jgi:hypothetical protein